MKKIYLAMLIWLSEETLKRKTAHFRLPSASQKRACLSSLMRDARTGAGLLMRDARTGAGNDGKVKRSSLNLLVSPVDSRSLQRPRDDWGRVRISQKVTDTSSTVCLLSDFTFYI